MVMERGAHPRHPVRVHRRLSVSVVNHHVKAKRYELASRILTRYPEALYYRPKLTSKVIWSDKEDDLVEVYETEYLPMLRAVTDNDLDGFNFLLQFNPDLSRIDHDGASILSRLLTSNGKSKDSLELLKRVLSLGVDPNKIDKCLKPALTTATSHEACIEVVNHLLQHGADPLHGYRNGHYRITALWYAAIHKTLPTIKTLICNGGFAEPELGDTENQTIHCHDFSPLRVVLFQLIDPEETNLPKSYEVLRAYIEYVEYSDLCLLLRSRSAMEIIERYSEEDRTWLQNAVTNANNLAHFCRRVIRQCVRNSNERINALPVPNKVKSYLHA